MTRANTEQSKHTPWFAQAGAACSIVPISRWVGPNAFVTKGNDYGVFFSVEGRDTESLTDEEIQAQLATLEGALRGLTEGFCLYQYARVKQGFELPRQKSYPNPIAEQFVSNRLEHLERNANFRRIDIHWCLVLEAPQGNPFDRKPKERADDTGRRLALLMKAATILEANLGHAIGLKILGKEQAFQFLSYLFNLEEWSECDHLREDTGVDRQIVKSAIRWEADHLRVGKRFVQAFSLKTSPEASRPDQFAELLLLDADAVLCSTWRPKSSNTARKEIDQQEKFTSFFKIGIASRIISARDQGTLETTAGAKAANLVVDDLSDAIRSLDKKVQGLYSLTLLVAARSAEQLLDVAPTVHRAFVGARAQVMEETLGNLSAFYAMFPGNQKFQVFSMWLSEEHHARLSSIFAPSLGHQVSEDLGDAEYLNVFETRSGTPFFQDAYSSGVRVSLTIGPPGSGKSVQGNLAVAHEQKYNGFTYIFDIGGSYESVVELYGGRVDKVGKDGPRVNPFALEPTEANLQFLQAFVKLLLTNSGAEISPEDDDTVFKAVRGLYHLPAHLRRLGQLFLPPHLQRFLGKWTGDGLYAAVFDNIEDSLSLARVQCFDFQGITKQYADLVEPLMVWLLRRIDDVLFDPNNLGVPKHVVIEELFTNMRNKQLLDAALSSIKTVRKNLGGVTLIAQSAMDLGQHADSIVNSCTSFLFLPDATFNREHYQRLFSLTDHQIQLFESLQPREALYIRRDGVTKVLRLNLDPHSYAAFSTKPKDRVRRGKLIDRYGLQEGLKRFADGEAA
jgi:type IV secretion system protein VirB4